MVGLIQTILLDLVETTGSDGAVDRVRAASGVPADRDFRMDVAYDDEEWQRLLAAAIDELGIAPQQAVDAYAKHFLIDAQQRFPMWFQMSPNAKSLLMRQPAIHNGFATGVSDPAARSAIEDKFDVTESDAGLRVRYKSPNGLCALYISLAKEVLAHYGEEANITESKCMARGDNACEIELVWAAVPSGV